MSVNRFWFLPVLVGTLAIGLSALPSSAAEGRLTVEGLIRAYNYAGCPNSIDCLNRQEKLLASMPEHTWTSQEFGTDGVVKVLEAAYNEYNCCGISHRYNLVYDILPESFWKSRESMNDFASIIQLAKWPDSLSLPYAESTQKFIVDKIPAKVWCGTSEEYMVDKFSSYLTPENWQYAWGVWVEANTKVCPVN